MKVFTYLKQSKLTFGMLHLLIIEIDLFTYRVIAYRLTSAI